MSISDKENFVFVDKLSPDNRSGLNWVARKLTRFMNDWLDQWG